LKTSLLLKSNLKELNGQSKNRRWKSRKRKRLNEKILREENKLQKEL